MPIISSSVITNRVRALAGDSGLSVQLSDKDVAATDGKTIFLKRPAWDWSKDELTIWEGNAYHEIGHCAPKNKDVFDVIQNTPVHMASRLGKCLNALDDLRQEDEQYGKFIGRDRVMGESNVLMIQRHVDDGLFSKSGDENVEFMQVLIAYMTLVMEWYPAMSGMAERVASELLPGARAKFATLVDHHDEINPLGLDAPKVYERAKRMLELLGYDPEKEEQDARDQEEAEKQFSEDAKAFAEEICLHEHTDEFVEVMSEEGEADSYTLVNGKLQKEDGEEVELPPSSTIPPSRGGYVPSDWNKMILFNYASNPSKVVPNREALKLVDKGMFLGTQVRKLLQTMSMTRNIHGLKKGRLGKNLHRATMKDSGGYQQKVFKQKTQAVSLDVAVQLVVDGSGSMSGCKYEAASASAAILSVVLTQLQVKHEVIVFTEVHPKRGYDPVLQHGIVKSFDKPCDKDQILSNFAGFAAKGLAQNLDGESIMWSACRLLRQPTVRKIMVVFSDGQPAAYRGGATDCTEQAIKELEERRDMELYGIGILSNAVKDFYRDCEVIRDINTLEAALLGVIKSKILSKGVK